LEKALITHYYSTGQGRFPRLGPPGTQNEKSSWQWEVVIVRSVRVFL